MFTKISSAQLLAVTKWSRTDLDNRAHANQLALAYGLTLPAATDTYIGLDCYACLLSDMLVEPGHTRALAGRFVREFSGEWTHGLGRVEWSELFPPSIPAPWAPPIAEGLSEFSIYFAVAQYPGDDFRAASGTWWDIVRELGAAPPMQVTPVDLCQVYDSTLAAAAQAGVDLGAPFTRPEGHPEHREWFAAVEVHRALSLQRAKVRKLPGPPRAKAKAKAKGQRRDRVRAPAKMRA